MKLSDMDKLKADLTQSLQDEANGGIQNPLDVLSWYYLGSKTIFNKTVFTYYQKMDAHFRRLSEKEVDEIYSDIYKLCAERERIAFAEGVRVGTNLARKLQDNTVVR